MSAVELDDGALQNRVMDSVRAYYRESNKSPSAFRVEVLFDALSAQVAQGKTNVGGKMKRFLLETMAWRYLFDEEPTSSMSHRKLTMKSGSSETEDTGHLARRLSIAVQERRDSGAKVVPYGWTILPKCHPNNEASTDLESAHMLHDPAFSAVADLGETESAEYVSALRQSSMCPLGEVLTLPAHQGGLRSQRRQSEGSSLYNINLEDPAFSTIPKFLPLTEERKKSIDWGKAKAVTEHLKESREGITDDLEADRNTTSQISASVRKMLIDHPDIAVGFAEALIKVAKAGRDSGDPRTDVDRVWHVTH